MRRGLFVVGASTSPGKGAIPDTELAGTTVVGCRYAEEEISALSVQCAGYFDRAIKPPPVILHGPGGTERLRG